MPKSPWTALILFSMAAAGCGGRTEVVVPKYDAESMTRDAFARFDSNKDGKLDAGELKGCPSLAEALVDLDTNKDMCIDTDELKAPLAELAKGTTGLMDMQAIVVRGGFGLANATVTLIPEDFMGNTIKGASGVSSGNGSVTFQTPESPYPGIQPGFYRVTVSLQEGGTERLAPRFNTQTTLGKAVTLGRRGRWEIRVE